MSRYLGDIYAERPSYKYEEDYSDLFTPPKKKRRTTKPKVEEYDPEYPEIEEEKTVRAPKRSGRVQPSAGETSRTPDWQGDIERLRDIESWAANTRERLLGSIRERSLTPRPRSKKQAPEVPYYEPGPSWEARKPLGRGRGRGKATLRI